MCPPNMLCVPVYIYADVYMTYEYSRTMVQKTIYFQVPHS